LQSQCDNGSQKMGVPGGDVHLLAVWKQGMGNRFCVGRGPGFFAPGLEERSDGRGGVKKGGRSRHGEHALEKGRKTEGDTGAWRERSDRRVRRGDPTVAARRNRAWVERRTGGPQRKEGPVSPEAIYWE
jgi:hypothetical protein